MSGVWAGLVRVSDMGMRKEGDDSFRAGRDQIAAIERGIPAGDSVEILKPEYNVSGGLGIDKRPSLRKAVEGVEAGAYCGVIVAYHSRLGRDVEIEEAIWRRIEAAGGRILFAQDGIDTTTVDGRAFRRIRSAFNHAERERHVERFDALRRDLVQEGVWQTRVVPLGYSKDRRLVPNDQAERVRAAYRAKASGVSTYRIAAELGMSPSGTNGLLRNRVYLGELRVGPYVNPSAHPAIVDTDLWLRAQHAPVVYHRKEGRETMLDGLVRCAGCGHTMSRGGENASVWACRRIYSTGQCPSPAGVRSQLLDPFVEEIVRKEIARLVASPARSTIPLQGARERLRRAEAERDAYLEAVRAADLGASVFASGLRSRQGEVQKAEKELARLLGAGERVSVPVDLLEEWERWNARQRNHALRGLIDHVEVSRAGGRGGGSGPRRPLAERVRVVFL